MWKLRIIVKSMHRAPWFDLANWEERLKVMAQKEKLKKAN